MSFKNKNTDKILRFCKHVENVKKIQTFIDQIFSLISIDLLNLHKIICANNFKE
jgi:hypothetical protein